MPVPFPRFTVDDLAGFPDDGNRYELLDGNLLVTPAPAFQHDVVVNRLRDLLTGYLDGAAGVSGHGAVQVRPRHHLEPDLLVYGLQTPLPKRWSDLKELVLAIEVSGRGSRVYDRDFKQGAYGFLGVEEAWRVDLLSRTVEVSRRGGAGVTIVRRRLVWSGPSQPAPLVIDVPNLFQDIDSDD